MLGKVLYILLRRRERGEREDGREREGREREEGRDNQRER